MTELVRAPELVASYVACKRLHRRHGRTYYLSTFLLPPWKRPYVHALYGFARYADDLVDGPDLTPAEKAAQLDRWSRDVLADLRAGQSSDPIAAAVVDTAQRWGIPVEHFAAFLDSMRRDLTVSEYATYDDLLGYTYGSAAVIGLQMLPILEPVSADAAGYARDLGIAFQLTNFLRDVGEDLDRGRLYLPLEDLTAYGVTRADLEARRVTAPIRELLAFEVERTRALYRRAEPGIDLLHPTSRACIRTAYRLYGAILDRIERSAYQVLDRRATVSTATRARIGLAGALGARRAHPARGRTSG